jgi:hypothetical protein
MVINGRLVKERNTTRWFVIVVGASLRWRFTSFAKDFFIRLIDFPSLSSLLFPNARVFIKNRKIKVWKTLSVEKTKR